MITQLQQIHFQFISLFDRLTVWFQHLNTNTWKTSTASLWRGLFLVQRKILFWISTITLCWHVLSKEFGENKPATGPAFAEPEKNADSLTQTFSPGFSDLVEQIFSSYTLFSWSENSVVSIYCVNNHWELPEEWESACVCVCVLQWTGDLSGDGNQCHWKIRKTVSFSITPCLLSH